MCVGYTTPMPVLLAKMRGRGSASPRPPATSRSPTAAPTDLPRSSPPSTIRTHDIKKGIAKVIKPNEALVDHLIHHQDIRRPPTGRACRRTGWWRRWTSSRDSAASSVRSSGWRVRLVATDVDWSHGSGPEVSGPGEALLLAASGRPAGLPELDGEGVAVLRERLAA